MTELEIQTKARRELWESLADLVSQWQGEETREYIYAKMVLLKWKEPEQTSLNEEA